MAEHAHITTLASATRRRAASPAGGVLDRRSAPIAPHAEAAVPASAATRRNLFGSMGALLLLSATEAEHAKAADLDGELLACCAKVVEMDRESERLLAACPSNASASHPAWLAYDAFESAALDRWSDAFDRIVALPARTPDGLRAKAAVAQSVIPDSWRDDSSPTAAIALSIFADLAGRVAA